MSVPISSWASILQQLDVVCNTQSAQSDTNAATRAALETLECVDKQKIKAPTRATWKKLVLETQVGDGACCKQYTRQYRLISLLPISHHRSQVTKQTTGLSTQYLHTYAAG